MVEDLDPPSFQFGRVPEQREQERSFLPDPDDLLDFEEPEGAIEREPEPPTRSWLRRLVPEMSETTSPKATIFPNTSSRPYFWFSTG